MYYPYGETILDIPSSRIDSIVTTEWGDTEVLLNTTYTCRGWRDSVRTCIPVVLVDDAGNDVDYETIEAAWDDRASLQAGFPYFTDYTMGGVFPEMTTRQAWVDFIADIAFE
jgi:hypothetical protein